MPAARLRRCPDCGYSLKGLPARHRCPECGFEYDDHTHVWRPRHPWKVYVYVLGIPVLWLSALVNGVAQTYMLSAKPTESYRVIAVLLHFCVVVGAPVFLFWRGFRSNRRGRFAALTPKGIRVRSRDLDIDLSWEDIADVTAKRAGDPEIRQHGSRRAHVIRFIFDDGDEVARFCAAATRAKERYARSPCEDDAQAAGSPVPESVPRREQTA